MIKILLVREKGDWLAKVKGPGDTRIVTLGTRDLITAMGRARQLYPAADIDVKDVA